MVKCPKSHELKLTAFNTEVWSASEKRRGLQLVFFDPQLPLQDSNGCCKRRHGKTVKINTVATKINS